MGETDKQNENDSAHSPKTQLREQGQNGAKEEKERAESKRRKKAEAEHRKKAEAEHKKKAELETKVRDRVSLEAKAFDIVNRLIEPGITPEYLLEACLYIDHNHYGDIVEERAIACLCGYPICNNQLRNVSRKKYHISTKTNTVYDITDRKRFCSNECYHSSQHLEAQIPRTPVWTRRDGDDVKFQLLQTKVKGPLEGEEVISSKILPLRQEVLQLEKMDQRTREASKAQRTKVATREALKESQKLSEELLSLSKEEDQLDTHMKHLSLGREEEQKEGNIASAAGGSCLSDAKSEGEKIGTTLEAEENVRLESAMGHLTLKEEEQKTAGSDEASNEDCDDLAKDLTLPADSSTDKGTLGVSKDSRQHSDARPGNSKKTVDFMEDSACGTDTPSRLVEAGMSSQSHSETNQKLPAPELRQQPGESKTEYLMRLLNKRQNLFSKVAAVQANATVGSEIPESVNVKAVSPEEKENVNKRDNAESLETQNGKHQRDQTAVKSENRVEQPVTGLESKESPTIDQDRRKNKSDSKLTPKQPKAHVKQSQKTPLPESPQAHVSPLNSVCQIISQWVTPETLSYLGLNSVESEDESKSHSSDSMFHKDPEMQRKYQELCQHLDHQEKDFDDVLGVEENLEEKENASERRPLPDYEELKKQTMEHQLRVQQFLRGSSASQKKKTKGDSDDDAEDQSDSKRNIVLPAIDSHNQLLIRRRIVLERLNCALPNLLPPLGLSVQDISGPLRELVFTFSLTSVNIVLKPAEWTLVSILVLQVLAKKSQAVVAALRSEARTKSLNIVLGHFGHTSSSLEQLVHETLLTHRVE